MLIFDLKYGWDIKQKTIFETASEIITILDKNGNIVATNDAWTQFAVNNDISDFAKVSIGTNYIDVCNNSCGANCDGAKFVAQGISNLLNSDIVSPLIFTHEYPCDSQSERRWFKLSAYRISILDDIGVVIIHENITYKKIKLS